MESSKSKRKRLKSSSKSNPSSKSNTQQESRDLLQSHASENSPEFDYFDENYDDEEDIDMEDPPPPKPAEVVQEVPPTNAKSKFKKIPKRAVYWKYFKEIKDSEGKTARAECIFCKVSYAANSRINGTGNLIKHWKSCVENPENQSKGNTQTTLSLEQLDGDGNCIVRSSTVDLDAVRVKLCRLIIGEELPFSFVSKFLFRDLFASACPTFSVPSRSTITRDAYKMYADEREKLKIFLKNHTQRVCLTTDTWTSIQNVNYMALTVHFVDNDWNLQRRILNFCTISGHKGDEIARDVEDCLRSWDLSKKLFTLTVDNASANDLACVKLKEMVVAGGSSINGGKNLHMRCCAHIANLIVKDGLKEQVDVIDKVRTIVKFVRSSPSRMRLFKEEALMMKVDSKCTLVSDVPTRWNYTYVMLDVALKYKQVFPRLDIPRDDDGLGHLSAEEWAKVEVIVAFLKDFYDFTNSVSGSSDVTVSAVYLYIGGIVHLLNEQVVNDDAICRSMAVQMKKKCDKYWDDIKKMNMFVFVGMLLDPMYKFNVLKCSLQRLYGEEKGYELAMQVRGRTKEIFEEYRTMYTPSSSSSEVGSSIKLRPRADLRHLPPTLFIKSVTSDASKLNESVGSMHASELDRYLDDDDVNCHDYDVLTWWKMNGHRFPILARMARDVLAIPVTTVPSESAFSAGGRTIDQFRSKLDPKVMSFTILMYFRLLDNLIF